jgi:hypothetical protein
MFDILVSKPLFFHTGQLVGRYAERLSPAFKTKTGIPIMDVNFKSGKPHQPAWTQKSSVRLYKLNAVDPQLETAWFFNPFEPIK